MKHFFKLHAEWVLVGVAVIMLSVLVGGFVWAIIFSTENVGRAIDPTPGGAERIGFNMKDAEKLDLHGLRDVTSTMAVASSTALVASSSAPSSSAP